MLQQNSGGKKRYIIDKAAEEPSPGEESASWNVMEIAGRRPVLRGMWEHFSCERSKAKKFREDAEKEKQAGIQDQWQRESPSKEYLEQVMYCKDTDCTPLEAGTDAGRQHSRVKSRVALIVQIVDVLAKLTVVLHKSRSSRFLAKVFDTHTLNHDGSNDIDSQCRHYRRVVTLGRTIVMNADVFDGRQSR